MNLYLLLVLSMLSLACAWPATVEQEQPLAPQESPQLDQEQAREQATLQDMEDIGGQHAQEGSRNARWLWGGWNYYRPRYYYYSNPWSYRNSYHSYWW